MYSITPIKAFNDNYIWCLTRGDDAIVVDPGCANSVLNHLTTNNLHLKYILITHHHQDHTGGITQLKQKTQASVYAPVSLGIKEVDKQVKEDDIIHLFDLKIRVLSVPGHTLDHLAYYLELPGQNAKPLSQPTLFCGDTLFSIGCGRLFEGSAAQMWESLSKILSLPSATMLYPAHEYTLSNIRFAKTIMPNNEDLKDYETKCIAKRELDLPTLPTRLELEKRISPFLNYLDKDVQRFAIEKTGKDQLKPEEVFACIRQAKDKF